MEMDLDLFKCYLSLTGKPLKGEKIIQDFEEELYKLPIIPSIQKNYWDNYDKKGQLWEYKIGINNYDGRFNEVRWFSESCYSHHSAQDAAMKALIAFSKKYNTLPDKEKQMCLTPFKYHTTS